MAQIHPLAPLLNHAAAGADPADILNAPLNDNAHKVDALLQHADDLLASTTRAIDHAAHTMTGIDGTLGALTKSINEFRARRLKNPLFDRNSLITGLLGLNRPDARRWVVKIVELADRLARNHQTAMIALTRLEEELARVETTRQALAGALAGMRADLESAETAPAAYRQNNQQVVTDTLTAWSRLDRLWRETEPRVRRAQGELDRVERAPGLLRAPITPMGAPCSAMRIKALAAASQDAIDEVRAPLAARADRLRALADTASTTATSYQLSLAIQGTLADAERLETDAGYRAEADRARHARQTTATAPGWRAPRRRTPASRARHGDRARVNADGGGDIAAGLAIASAAGSAGGDGGGNGGGDGGGD